MNISYTHMYVPFGFCYVFYFYPPQNISMVVDFYHLFLPKQVRMLYTLIISIIKQNNT